MVESEPPPGPAGCVERRSVGLSVGRHRSIRAVVTDRQTGDVLPFTESSELAGSAQQAQRVQRNSKRGPSPQLQGRVCVLGCSEEMLNNKLIFYYLRSPPPSDHPSKYLFVYYFILFSYLLFEYEE